MLERSLIPFTGLIILLALPAILCAQQVPRTFPYQGVARDGGAIVTGIVGLRFVLRRDSPTGPVAYVEQHTTDTNPEGVFSVVIGQQDPASFSSIDWAKGPYFLQVGLDPTGGVKYTDLGVTPIRSVPFALYAAEAHRADTSDHAFTALHAALADSAVIAKHAYTAGRAAVADSASIAKHAYTAVRASIADSAAVARHAYTADRAALADSAVIAKHAISAGTALDDMDRDSTNEIQTLALNGQQLTLSKNGGTVSLPASVGYTAGAGIGISNNVITNTAPAVNPTLSLSGQTLTVNPGGSSVVLPSGGSSKWTLSGDNIYRTTGKVGIGTSTPGSRLSLQGDMGVRNSQGDERVWISTAAAGATGYMETYGPNLNPNVLITSVSGYNNHGAVVACDWLGNQKVAIYVNAASEGVLFTSPGYKNFRMEHPENPGKDIWYCSLEGPEAGVYDRGTGQLVEGEAFIPYSDHFLLVMNPETVTVNLTPREWDTFGLAVTEIGERGFRVRELKNGKGNFTFFWEVKGKIRGHEAYRVIRDRSESLLIDESNTGSGPVPESGQ